MLSRMLADPLASLPHAVAATLDDSSRNLAHRTAAWAAGAGVLDVVPGARGATLVVVASVYAGLCAPPAASARSLDLAARFTLIFFCIDDASPEDLLALVGSTGRSVGPLTRALTTWRDELPELDTCAPVLRRHFERSFVDYLEARRREPTLRPGALDLEAHWALRRSTIFMDPYLDQWMISTGIDGAQLAHFEEARALATDVVLLANDLGSVARDRSNGEAPDDLNLLETHRRQHGVGEGEAIEALVTLHNALVGRFDQRLATSIEAGGPSARASTHAHATLLRSVVEGNLDSLFTLAFRYAGARPLLERLARCRPLP